MIVKSVVSCRQIRSGAPAQVFPPRRPANEHQLAGLGDRQRQRYSAEHRTRRRRRWRRRRRRKDNAPSTALPQERLPAGSKHHPDHCNRLLLCQYIFIYTIILHRLVVRHAFIFRLVFKYGKGFCATVRRGEVAPATRETVKSGWSGTAPGGD